MSSSSSAAPPLASHQSALANALKGVGALSFFGFVELVDAASFDGLVAKEQAWVSATVEFCGSLEGTVQCAVPFDVAQGLVSAFSGDPSTELRVAPSASRGDSSAELRVALSASKGDPSAELRVIPSGSRGDNEGTHEDERIMDLLGELANMVCGSWLSRTCSHDVFSLRTPRVTRMPVGWAPGTNPGETSVLALFNDRPIALWMTETGSRDA